MIRDNSTWNDIGYHFMIGLDGTIYQGRSLRKKGAGMGPADKKVGAIHIVILGDLHKEFIGTYDWKPDLMSDDVTATPFASLYQLSYYLSRVYSITSFGGHQQYYCNHTVCPGNNAMPFINVVGSLLKLSTGTCLLTDD